MILRIFGVSKVLCAFLSFTCQHTLLHTKQFQLTFLMTTTRNHLSVRVADPHHFNADLTFYFKANLDPAFNFTLIRIRIQLLFKIMEICDHWSTYTVQQILQGFIVSLQASIQSVSGTLKLYFELLKLLNLNLDPKIIQIYADPDPQPCSTSKYGTLHQREKISNNNHETPMPKKNILSSLFHIASKRDIFQFYFEKAQNDCSFWKKSESDKNVDNLKFKMTNCKSNPRCNHFMLVNFAL